MIRTPENWPMAWWSADASVVRMSCPGCGEFQLYLDRTGGKAKIACRSCTLAGVAEVQAALDTWRQRHAAALAESAAAHQLAMEK